MEPRKHTSWLRPEIRVRAQFLKGEETLRHATVKSIVSIQSGRCRRAKASPLTEPSYPKPHIDQAALPDYYEAVGELMLPWLSGRPLNLLRCTGGRCFFQRNRNHPATDQSFAEPIHSLPIIQKNGKTEAYLFVEDVPGILACVEADAVELHGWGSLVDDVERPNRIALDLDPDPGLGFDEVKNAAFDLRRHLEAIGLESWPLLTGGKGIHVIVPLTPAADWEEVREFAKRFCTLLAEAEPQRFTVQIAKAQRSRRIFLDYLRNQRTATAVMPYSARARPGLPVAAPVAWEELASLMGADVFRTEDVQTLAKRARSKKLRGWGRARQRLPML
jgi:bifunctional non-homologous end joining protein LigD